MHARREGGRVDVIFNQQDLSLGVLVSNGTQLADVVPHWVQRVSLPAIHNHHNALPGQSLRLRVYARLYASALSWRSSLVSNANSAE